jgi:hypothetical protein
MTAEDIFVLVVIVLLVALRLRPPRALRNSAIYAGLPGGAFAAAFILIAHLVFHAW